MSSYDDDDSSDAEEPLESQFISAVVRNDLLEVQELIDRDVDVNYTEQNHHAMCICARRGYLEMCKLLASNYCELDHVDVSDSPWFRQPIHFAATRGHPEVVEYLLSAGISPDVRDGDHRTALYWAATYEHMDIVDILVRHAADLDAARLDGFTALHAATCLGKINVCEYLLGAGASVNTVDTTDGWSVLHAAVCYNHPQVIGKLLRGGADVNQLTHDGDAPLHIAADFGNLNVVRLLCQRGAHVNVRSRKSMTPLYLAVYKSHPKIVKYLLKQGADPNVATEVGYTAIIMAVTTGQYDVVHLLARAGCDLNDLHYIPLSPLLRDKYLDKPRSLFDQACIVVRRCIGEGLGEKGRNLPLPNKFKDIITLSDIVVENDEM